MGTAAITGVSARGLFFEKQLDNTRAGAAQSFPTIHSARGTRNKKQPLSLHKRPVPTSPLPLTPAFLQPSASGERSDIPRPCLKKQGRRGRAFPWGGSSLPDGRAFRIPFPSLGKVSPARERITNNFCLQKISSKTSTLLQIKNKQYLQIIRRTRCVQLNRSPPRGERITNNICR